MYRLVLFFILSASALIGEEVAVYRCVTSFSVTKPDSDSSERTYYSSIGEELGKIETGKESLLSIYEAWIKDSWNGEPFYGPVEKYIFKDSKGKLYVAHFEFKEGHKAVGKGVRFAIIPLTKVKGLKDKYSGSPYNGSSISDEGILKQLRALARLKPSKGGKE